MAVTHATTATGTNAGNGDIHKAEWNANHTVADGSFVAAKTSFTATDKVLGRSTAGAGNGEEITVTAAARSVLDDTTVANMRTTLGLPTASPGFEIDYVEFTSGVNITATTEAGADTIVTGSAVAYDGSTTVIIEFFCEGWETAATANGVSRLYLYDGSGSIGRMGTLVTPAAGALGVITPALCRRKLTPSNASHTYSIRGDTSTGTAIANAGAGGSGNVMPGYIRITRA